jgi:hypothetical protein
VKPCFTLVLQSREDIEMSRWPLPQSGPDRCFSAFPSRSSLISRGSDIDQPSLHHSSNMSDRGRGRSRTPKSLSPSPPPRHRRGSDVSMSPARSKSRSRSRSPRGANGSSSKPAGGYRVVVISGLSKNVQRGHLEEIFGEYGRVTGLDLPLFKVCKLTLSTLLMGRY